VIVRRPDSLADAQAMLDAALEKFGRVDQLVVASGYNKPGFIQDLEYEDWQAVMDANVRGIWFMAKAVGTYWIEKKIKGKVLTMSSVRGRHGNVSGYTGYCTSKGATDSLTRARALSRIPLGRLGEVEDLVGMAIYLLSPASDFCTGQIMYVDGGYTAG